jgi:hypothetical protein
MKMIRIILNDEQAEAVAHSEEAVEICDREGKVLGVITPALSAKEVECAAKAKRALASDQPRYSIEQVLGHLDKLAGK